MNISYKRNGIRNFLVVTKPETGAALFREKMIVRNRVERLASMTVQSIDEKTSYYYDISGMVNLESMYAGRSLKAEEVRRLLSDVYELMSQVQRYMLSFEEILFSPEYVWVMPDTLETLFIYVPGISPGEEHGIKALAEFLADHVDGSDREAAEEAFDYLEAVENGDMLPRLKERGVSGGQAFSAGSPGSLPGSGATSSVERSGSSSGYASSATAGSSAIPGSSIPIDPSGLWDIKEDMSDDMKKLFGKEEVDPDRKKKTVYLCLAGAAAAAVFYILLVLFPGIFPFELNDTEYTALGIGIAGGFAILLTVVFRVYNKRDSSGRDDNMAAPRTPTGYRAEDDIEFFEQEKSREAYDDRTVLLTRPPAFRMGEADPVLKRKDGADIVLSHFPFVLGKMEGRVDEVVSDRSVSRIHAMIKEHEGRYYLSDLNSLNGTCLNGKKLDVNSTAEICDGDQISLADASFTFRKGTMSQASGGF